jgi:hypothetical protein
MEWRAGMEVLLSAVRKIVGKARRNNMIGSEDAASKWRKKIIRRDPECLICTKPYWSKRQKLREATESTSRSALIFGVREDCPSLPGPLIIYGYSD